MTITDLTIPAHKGANDEFIMVERNILAFN